MKRLVTIAILTFNGEAMLGDILDAIAKQKTSREVEILIIDSGSTDKTIEILKEHPKVHLHQIPNSEFGHGRTRNLAIELAKGEYVLFLTQDAIPAHERWLDAMIEPFEISDKIACVLGSQIPHANAPAPIKREVETVFRAMGPRDAISLHRKNQLTDELGLVNTFLSNTNSAVRKELLLKIPFRDVDYAEDQGLGIDLLEAGYYKAYSPLGAVDHSHDYSVIEYFRRKFDEYVGLRKTTGYTATAGYRELILGSAKATLKDWLFIIRDPQYRLIQKAGDFIKSPFYNAGLRLAIRAAGNTKKSTKKQSKYSLEARARSKK
jgi:rhamnosyltransferase